MGALTDWMESSGETVASLAPLIPVHEVNLRKFRAGKRPCWRVMERLAEISGGAVTPNDWLPAGVRAKAKRRALGSVSEAAPAEAGA